MTCAVRPQKLAAKTREVCYSGFALKHSGITRTPIYSAEHMTSERMLQGNRTDRISIYGSIDLTKDKQGLEHASQLKIILDLALAELEHSDLPDQIAIVTPKTVKNPFV